MKTLHLVRVLSLAIPVLLAPSCDSSLAQAAENDQHAAVELAPTSVTVFGERALLFMEHPHLVRGEDARFLAHLSVLASGDPVRAGRVSLSIGDTTLVAAAPARDGLFIPEGSVPAAGRFAARLSIESEQVSETLDLGLVVVHADRHAAEQAALAAAGEEPAGAVPFLMEQQWKIQLLLDEARPRHLLRRLVVPARARTPEGAEAEIHAPLAGRTSAPPGGSWPRSGERVDAGQVLGQVEPPLGASELAQLEALDLELDLRSLEVLRAAQAARTRLAFAERERGRLMALREHGLCTVQELDQAERDLDLARGEDDAARANQTVLERLLAARAQRRGGATGPTLRFAVTSPISGTVIECASIAGVPVEPDDVLARVLDTRRTWIEGRVFEFDLELVRKAPALAVSFPALPGKRVDVAASAITILPEVDPESRTLIVRCELDNGDGAIAAGMLAELEIAVEAVDATVSVPREAVVIDQGLPIAYVMLEGELFQKRELELGVEDGPWVEVRRGIAPGERVATRGAYVVKLAALSPASFGHGHAH